MESYPTELTYELYKVYNLMRTWLLAQSSKFSRRKSFNPQTFGKESRIIYLFVLLDNKIMSLTKERSRKTQLIIILLLPQVIILVGTTTTVRFKVYQALTKDW